MANTTGKKFGGRKKGTPNKLSATVKDNVISVFEELGGTDHMKLWAAENPTQFYNIYAKLLPTEVDVAGGLDHQHVIEYHIIDPKP